MTGTGGRLGLYISGKHNFVRRKYLLRVQHIDRHSMDSSLHLTDNFVNKFCNMLLMAPKENTKIILMGDLSINYLNNTNYCEIKDIFLLCGLMPIIKSPTHYDLHHN